MARLNTFNLTSSAHSQGAPARNISPQLQLRRSYGVPALGVAVFMKTESRSPAASRTRS